MICVGPTAIPTHDRIEERLVNHGIERLLREVHLSDVHLLPLEFGKFLPVQLLHRFDNSAGGINRRNVLIFLLKEVLAQSGSTAAHDQNLGVGVLDRVSDNLRNSSEALIPIEELLRFGVAVLPILLLAVLLHFFGYE